MYLRLRAKRMGLSVLKPVMCVEITMVEVHPGDTVQGNDGVVTTSSNLHLDQLRKKLSMSRIKLFLHQ